MVQGFFLKMDYQVLWQASGLDGPCDLLQGRLA